jgi:APA family basic amino acid/polyamine antiporter
VIYIIVGFVLTGIVSYKMLDVADPIAVAVNALGPNFIWLRLFIKLAISAGLTSVILVMLLAQSRILYTIAQDGLLPKAFCQDQTIRQKHLFSTVVVRDRRDGHSRSFPCGYPSGN